MHSAKLNYHLGGTIDFVFLFDAGKPFVQYVLTKCLCKVITFLETKHSWLFN